MAARENQGYLIAVIILVLLTLVLALSTFLGLSRMNENAAKLQAAEQKLVVQKSMSDAYQIEAQVLRAYVGEMGPSVAEVPSMFDSLDALSLNQKLTQNQRWIAEKIHHAEEFFEMYYKFCTLLHRFDVRILC